MKEQSAKAYDGRMPVILKAAWMNSMQLLFDTRGFILLKVFVLLEGTPADILAEEELVPFLLAECRVYPLLGSL